MNNTTNTGALRISSQGVYDLIIHPNFNHLADDYSGYYTGTLNEFTVMDNVSLSQGAPIADIFQLSNILQRKTASANTNWTQIGTTGTRRLFVNEMYGATKNCEEEFYDGAMKDFREQSPRFQDVMVDIFRKAISRDLAVNSYFGRVDRAADTAGKWSWNIYDGIFQKLNRYINEGTIASGQHYTITQAGAAITPDEAYHALSVAYDAQTDLMQTLRDDEKAFYVDKRLAHAYMRYLTSKGNNTLAAVNYIQKGLPVLAFEGVPVFVEPFWSPVLTALNSGNEAHAVILTLRGNFLFGTNKNYRKHSPMQGLTVWFSEDFEEWRQKMYLVAGTEIALPELVVVGTTASF